MTNGGGEIVQLNGFTPETPIDIFTSDGGVSLCVRDALKWLCPNVPEHEALKFLMVCKIEGLNPFLREIEIIPTSARYEIIITRAGYNKKANAHPAYDGIESGIIARPWDSKTKTFTGAPYEVPGTFLPPDHLLVGGWAKVYRKDRSRPSHARVSVTEYAKKGNAWEQIPCTMINKVACVHAFRESGLISSGWYDAAELAGNSTRRPVPGPPIGDPVTVVPAAITATATSIEREYDGAEIGCCPPDLLDRMLRILKAVGVDRTTDPHWRKALNECGVSRECDLTEMQAVRLLSRLESLEPHRELEPEAAQRWAAIVDQIVTVDEVVEATP